MDTESESNVPEIDARQEQLFTRLQPESELEERLVQQIALCNARLEHLEAVLVKARQQLHTVTEEPRGVPPR